MSRNRRQKKSQNTDIDKLEINDYVLHKNGLHYYIADITQTDSGRTAYRLSILELPTFTGILNYWVSEDYISLIEKGHSLPIE